jgi:hypothetical protein
MSLAAVKGLLPGCALIKDGLLVVWGILMVSPRDGLHRL